MAKTLEELKEMIDSVIVENDKGQITGQGLNLVLNEMSDALSEMGGGGGEIYQINIPVNEELTEEQLAFNAKQFAILESKLQNREFVQIGITGYIPSYGFMCASVLQVVYGDLLGTGTNSIMIVIEEGAVMLNPDGTITME